MPIYAQSSTLRSLLIPLVDIDQTTVANEDVLQYNATTGKFENQSLTQVWVPLRKTEKKRQHKIMPALQNLMN